MFKKYVTIVGMLLVGSCCFAPYKSGFKIEQPIRESTFIYVNTMYTYYSEAIGRTGVLEKFSDKVEEAVIYDLQQNVFPNRVLENADLYVTVEILKVHVDAMGKGEVDLKCILSHPDETEIISFQETGRSGMKFSITEASMAATKDAMEKVKMKINEHRQLITNSLRGYNE